jgi:hypothetical protein
MQVIKVVILIFVRTASAPILNTWFALFLLPCFLFQFGKSLTPAIPFISDTAVTSKCPPGSTVYSCYDSKHYLNGSNFYDTDNYYDFNIKAGQVEEKYKYNTKPGEVFTDSNLDCNVDDENYVKTRHHLHNQKIGTCFRLYIETDSSKSFKTITVEIKSNYEIKGKDTPTKTIKISKKDFKANGSKIYFNLYNIVQDFEISNRLIDGSLVKITNVEN